ncbi:MULTISPECIES: hypothetical protein [unclassified Polaromonas]|jgi:hypothetical protein|uniref:hypothetical protein n=1 Tax=unclassified Polaromonas TaxID=2638319 RepID=UPI000BBC2E9E|nr:MULTISPECIES: hypothetical protein [unclassified Polaromonas]MDP2449099.1 hypothetical protein [Polaromonas sp.]MDP3826478.1 hypothetical protein [Polaromonas sp.]OYY32494.1 MAG: hypothetical protein B7Y60_22250 [Polaromonas sp. 35-63-35]OYZ15999.1 MAG: hypothetical protein B7Y28_21760 [Polaromonas sp. 16-63-31]OYZ75833.1 MAG: hypothetical protein B7Y09_22865 [Polaromonas sp. 24-63-21]
MDASDLVVLSNQQPANGIRLPEGDLNGSGDNQVSKRSRANACAVALVQDDPDKVVDRQHTCGAEMAKECLA